MRNSTRENIDKSQLFCNQQILSEGQLVIYPLGITPETSSDGHFTNLLQGILMAALRPNSFSFQKFHRKLGSCNIHRLAAHGTQMHFHTALMVIDLGHMLKLSDIEIRIQFTIDAG